MNIRAILRRRSFWFVLILGVAALGVGQWGYSCWHDEWMRRALLGTWIADEGADPFDLDADGTVNVLGNGKKGHWWVANGVIYLSEEPRSELTSYQLSYSVMKYRIQQVNEDSLFLERGISWPYSLDLYLLEIPLGEHLRFSFGMNFEWKRVKP